MIKVRVNLLSWREIQRVERVEQFKKLSILAVIIGVLLSALAIYYVNGQIAKQEERNQFITAEIDRLKNVQKQLDEAKKQVEELRVRIETIKKLSYQRDDLIVLFGEIAEKMPQEIFVTTIDINKLKFILEGISERDNAITTLNQRLKGNIGISEPDMSERNTVVISGNELRKFKMNANRVEIKRD